MKFRPVARSGFVGVLYFKKVDFFPCFLRESGLFCMFLEKVDFFACCQGESGPFRMHFWVKVDFFVRFLGESGLFWPKLWTILDTFGIWLRAWLVSQRRVPGIGIAGNGKLHGTTIQHKPQFVLVGGGSNPGPLNCQPGQHATNKLTVTPLFFVEFSKTSHWMMQKIISCIYGMC